MVLGILEGANISTLQAGGCWQFTSIGLTVYVWKSVYQECVCKDPVSQPLKPDFRDRVWQAVALR